MTDPFTHAFRLCDDVGLVSNEVVTPGYGFDPSLTYIRQLNSLRKQGGNEPYTGEPFPCTGHAHLAGMHVRCTSPAHEVRAEIVTNDTAIAGLRADLARERERVAELEAALANDRGEGEPPGEGWTYHGDIWMSRDLNVSVQRVVGSSRRPDCWRGVDGRSHYQTAREAMRAASATLISNDGSKS